MKVTWRNLGGVGHALVPAEAARKFHEGVEPLTSVPPGVNDSARCRPGSAAQQQCKKRASWPDGAKGLFGSGSTTAKPRALLLGTALASTFLVAPAGLSAPAEARTACNVGNTIVALPAPPNQVEIAGPGDSIICVNTEPRTGARGTTAYFAAIELQTYGDNEKIFLDSSGPLESDNTNGAAHGVYTFTSGLNSTITITNTEAVTATAKNGRALGLFAYTVGESSTITIINRDAITAASAGSFGDAFGLYAWTYRSDSSITILNSGDLTVTSQSGRAYGIYGASGYPGLSVEENALVTITNTGNLTVTSQSDRADGIYTQTHHEKSRIAIGNSGTIAVLSKGTLGTARGIHARTDYENSEITITNTGNLTVTSQSDRAAGIYAQTHYEKSRIAIGNSGAITVLSNGRFGTARGIYARTNDQYSEVTIDNSGAISVRSYGKYGIARGIDARTSDENSEITILNSGELNVASQSNRADGIYARAFRADSFIKIDNTSAIAATTHDSNDPHGIYARTSGAGSLITIGNSGDIETKAYGVGGDAYGVLAYAGGQNSSIVVTNTGAITAKAFGPPGFVGRYPADSNAVGINTRSSAKNSAITIANTGPITVTADGEDAGAVGILALTLENGSPIAITNSGAIDVRTNGKTLLYNGRSYENPAIGILSRSSGTNSPINITNIGSVYAEGDISRGIYTYSRYANRTTITNTGTIGSSSHFAIDAQGAGTAHIYNAGTITGYVELTEQNDTFENQAGGVFETKKTSQFGGGNDVFVNEVGGTILGASNGNARESSGFQGLETFRNVGGTISLMDGGVGDKFTLANTPGDAGLNFEGGGFLAVDANLAGPGSIADTLIVDGNVSGVTEIAVNNASALPGALNREGIPVVYVTGATPGEGNFVLVDGPLDAGFFDYDLFFEPTGSGQWELRSFVGGSAHALPKLLTAAQDMWRQTSATWFDRTADLRVVLNGGGAPAYDSGSKSLVEVGPNGLTPAVWMKGGGGRLDRDGSATTSAYGRTYTYDLDNEFSTFYLQVGVDMGQYDVISQGDVLIFGVLGGFVGGKLDYDSLGDTFDFSGGQVGAYATYLKDGLFVDTLLNVHLYEINTPNLGFPDSLNASTVGLRTDAGYRFGSFTEGLFFEPLATIEVTWADIDGFAVGGNRVSFSDDANVRGRIGGRVGTTMQAWEGTTMEPFLIASLWGNLSEDNSARLVSSGTTFNFNDDLDDVWGEISGGVNLFNFSQTTSVFAKVDYTFGEDVQGIGGKAGVRVAW